MAHDTTIPELDEKGLREFGLVTGGIIAGLFGLFFPWLLEFGIPKWPWILGGVLAAWGLVAPATLGPVYRGWMKFGLLLSKITTPIILGLVFLIAVIPTALILRLKGSDPMARRLDADAETYRVTSDRPSPDNLEKPF
jgi:amino acid transporter